MSDPVSVAPHPVSGRNADDLCRAGVAAFRRRKFKMAAAEFEAWTALEPERADAHLALARTCALIGRGEDAKRHGERAAALAPKSFRTQLALARLAHREGNGRRRIAALKQAVGLRPSAVAMRIQLAGLMQRRLQHAEALKVAQEALTLAPHDPAAALATARCHVALKQPTEAAAILEGVGQGGVHAVELARLRAQVGARRDAAESTAQAVPARSADEVALTPDASRVSLRDDADAGPVSGPGPVPDPIRWSRQAGEHDVEGRISAAVLLAIDRRKRRLGLVDHLLIVRALILRDLRIHHRDDVLGVLSELVRPSVVVFVHYWLFFYLHKPMPGQIPIEVYTLAGFATWFAFNGSLIGSETGGKWAGGALFLPGVTDLHMRVAKAGWQVMLNLAFCLLAVAPLNLFAGRRLPFPDVPVTCAIFAMAGLMGFSLGLMLQRLQSLIPIVKTAEKLLSWALFVTSGLYFSIATTPAGVAYWFWYNPMLHLVEFERRAFDPGYPVALLDARYPALVTAIVLVLGFMIYRDGPCQTQD